MRSFGNDPLAVTGGLIVNHEASTAAGFAGQMLDANAGRYGGRSRLAFPTGGRDLAANPATDPGKLSGGPWSARTLAQSLAVGNGRNKPALKQRVKAASH